MVPLAFYPPSQAAAPQLNYLVYSYNNKLMIKTVVRINISEPFGSFFIFK